MSVHDLTTELNAPARVLERLIDNIETVVLGKRAQVELVVAALLCNGHVLLEDVPGTAKTVLARAIAGSIDGAEPSRIQCTPDLQPTDVTGLSIFNQKTREFEFRPGPIMANVVLVDEINRALPKTQSALLEAMAEFQVTVDGVTRELPRPFLLIATENPIEYEGTFPLPEAQLDRFLVRTALGYPDSDTEREIVQRQRGGHPLGSLRPVVTADEIRAAQASLERIYVDELIEAWVLGLVRSTRELDEASMGASVRGSLSFDRLLRAWALIHERDFVVPEDVEMLFMPVLAHRVVFSPRFLVRMRQVGREEALREFSERCFELAPRPTTSADDALAALRRSP